MPFADVTGLIALLLQDFPFEGAVITINEAYISPDDTPSASEAVFRGVLEEPHSITLAGFTCEAASLDSHKDMTRR